MVSLPVASELRSFWSSTLTQQEMYWAGKVEKPSFTSAYPYVFSSEWCSQVYHQIAGAFLDLDCHWK